MGQGSRLSPYQALELVRPLEEIEVQLAIFRMGHDKSPGPDGYTAALHKKSWPIVGELVYEAISEFFENEALLCQLNNAVVALIPKGKHEPSEGDFRPISCYNVIYKAISKILAERLAPMFDGIIDKA